MLSVMDNDVREYLDTIPMWARKKNSLGDIRSFLEEMGNPDDKMRIFHVAGTNGKGSVCAFLTSILRQAGVRVGTFVSPHLTDVKERFLLDGVMVSEEAFADSFYQVKALAETMVGRGYCHPTYFEFLFYMAMCIFGKEAPDYVVLETGLGGRLDTTNVIRHPLAAVITSISFDHMEYLGDTIEKIAWEKAGIIKPGVPVIYDSHDPAARAVIEKKAAEVGAGIIPVADSDIEIIEYRKNSIRAVLKLSDGSLLDAEIPSAAEYQVKNGLLAARACEPYVTKEQLAAGLMGMYWPARMEEVLPGFYLDGAHNEDGIREFVRTASRLCREEGKRAYVLFSAVSDKEHARMIREVTRGLPLDGVVTAALQSERGTGLAALLEEFACAGIAAEGYLSVEEAVHRLLCYRDEEHLLFCAGSLYLMGEVKEVLGRNRHD